MIKGKTPEEIRKTFNIKNDFTPAEEEQVCIEKKYGKEMWTEKSGKLIFQNPEHRIQLLLLTEGLNIL